MQLSGCHWRFPETVEQVRDNLRSPDDYQSQASELAMAGLKGFSGPIYYVGSDDQFDYFRVDWLSGYCRLTRGQATIAKRFEVGKGEPRSMGFPEVPYPARAE